MEEQLGWGKARAGQLQADAAVDPAQKIQAALSKWEQKMAEIERHGRP